MIKVVWKFEFEIIDKFEISMPRDCEILTVQVQNGTPCIWALVNPDVVQEKRVFRLAGTGHDIHYDMGVDYKYIGTFQLDVLVFHLFEYL